MTRTMPLNFHIFLYYSRALLEGKLGRLPDIKILDNQICARGSGSTDSCSGDSGGPLYAQVRFFGDAMRYCDLSNVHAA